MTNEVTDTDQEAEREPEDDVKMTIWEHLGELRKRLSRAALGLVAAAGVCWAFREKMLGWITTPYAVSWFEPSAVWTLPVPLNVVSSAPAVV